LALLSPNNKHRGMLLSWQVHVYGGRERPEPPMPGWGARSKEQTIYKNDDWGVQGNKIYSITVFTL